jgi:hypothetical protein
VVPARSEKHNYANMDGAAVRSGGKAGISSGVEESQQQVGFSAATDRQW